VLKSYFVEVSYTGLKVGKLVLFSVYGILFNENIFSINYTTSISARLH